MTQNTDIVTTHHQVDDNPVQTALETFRVKFPYTRVMVYDDCLAYNITRKYLGSAVLKEANTLIKALKLPLKASLSPFVTDTNLIIEPKHDL